jgi:methylmalonyl-CoA carboxyltransferase large subunit
MARVTVTDLAGTLEQLRAQIAELSQRLEVLEKSAGRNGTAAAAAPAAATLDATAPSAAASPAPAEAAPAGITEEELLAISAAIAAYLGVRAHIRQIRLLSTNAWAQQGRVSIQASHSLQG